MNNLEKIKSMSKNELVNFLCNFDIDKICGQMCRDCQKKNGGKCPAKDDFCVYPSDDEFEVGYWLDMEVGDDD